MDQFISKLQYKTSEKGEFFEEKPRNLADTIELIKNFPWNIEQFADGPSVTIQDPEGNFLKIGIYFGGRFSLYYFETSNHLYEYQSLDIDKVYAKTNEFFNCKIDLHGFDKYSFAIFKKTHFITKQFEYRITVWKVFVIMTVWELIFLPFLIFTVLILAKNTAVPSMLLILVVLTLIFGRILAYVFNKYYKSRNQFLKISRGNDIFLFREDNGEIRTYNKVNISKILHYTNKNTRSPNMIEVFEMIFNDGSTITFTNVLITEYTLCSKFSDKWKFAPINIPENYFKLMRRVH
jgi:hypothetical protein